MVNHRLSYYVIGFSLLVGAAASVPAVLLGQGQRGVIPSLLGPIVLRDSDPTDNTDPELYTNDLTVEVQLPAIAGVPLSIQLSELSDFSSLVTIPYTGQASVLFTLSPGDGDRTVYARLTNLLGIGGAVSDTIELDTLMPISEAISPTGTINQASPEVDIEFNRDDQGTRRSNRASGVKSTRVIYTKDGSSPQQYNGEFSSSTRQTITFDTSQTGGDGHYEVWTESLDHAGNREDAPGEPDIVFDFVTTTTNVPAWETYQHTAR